jgi:hypothetical protein
MLKLSTALIIFGVSPTFYSFAATHPTTIVPDNVVTCQADSGCTNQTMFGRTYKVIRTPGMVVMVSLSGEGPYTRADVSILNNGTYPTQVTPDDFRVEVVSPKPHVLLYVAPENLKDLPLPTPEPDVKAPVAAATPAETATPQDPSKPLDIDQLYIAKKKQLAAQEAAEKAAAQKHLEPTPVPPNEVVRGRVYFERDKSRKTQLVNVVLPIGGMVYQFPYVIHP